MKTKLNQQCAEKKQWFIMTDGGLGVLSCASFGPINDLAYARLAANRLKNAGVKCGVYSSEYAKETDMDGFMALIKKYPQGMDCE